MNGMTIRPRVSSRVRGFVFVRGRNRSTRLNQTYIPRFKGGLNENLSKVIIILTAFIVLFPESQVDAQKKPNVYRNTEHAFSIVFPDGWSTRGGQTSHSVVVAEDDNGASIVIQVRELPQDISWDQYSDQYLQQTAQEAFDELKRKMFRDAVLESHGVTYLSNRKAIKIVLRHSVRTTVGTFPMRTRMFMVMGNMRAVTIVCSAPVSNFKTVEKVFQRSYGTFLFEDPSWYKNK